MLKKINLLRILIFLGLFLMPTVIFQGNYEYYDALQKPFLAPDSNLFSTAFYLIAALMALFFTYICGKHGYNEKTKFTYLLIFINYILFFVFISGFYHNDNLYLSFIYALLLLISVSFLIFEALRYDKRATIFLIPYLVIMLYLIYIGASIYLMN